MCTVNMTFEVPETKHINIEALKKQMHSYLEFILSMPSLTTIEENNIEEEHIFDCFDGGGWAEDPRTAHEIANDLHANRVNNRSMIEPW